jgi:PST family polysaccharide transporter
VISVGASVVLLRPQDKNALLITAIVGGILIFQAVDTIDLWFQSQNQNRRTVVPKLLAYVFTNGVKIVLIYIHASLILFAFALLLDVIIAAIGLCVSYHRFPIVGEWRFYSHQAKDLIKESFPFLLSGLSIMIYMRIDQVMIREMVSEGELGLYSAAIALSSFGGFIPLILSIVLGPYVAKKKSESEQAYYDTLQIVFRVYGALSIAIVVLIIIFGPLAVDLLFGNSYAGAKNILSIHVFTNIFIFLGIAQGLWIVNEQAGRIRLYQTFIGVMVCLGGNILLIPKYGGAGAAIVAVLVQFSSAVGSNVIFSRPILRLQLSSIFPFGLVQLMNRTHKGIH